MLALYGHVHHIRPLLGQQLALVAALGRRQAVLHCTQASRAPLVAPEAFCALSGDRVAGGQQQWLTGLLARQQRGPHQLLLPPVVSASRHLLVHGTLRTQPVRLVPACRAEAAKHRAPAGGRTGDAGYTPQQARHF